MKAGLNATTLKLRNIFEKFDRNGNGALDLVEAENLIGAFEKLSEGRGKLTPETLIEEAKEEAHHTQMNQLTRQVANLETAVAGIQTSVAAIQQMVMQVHAGTILVDANVPGKQELGPATILSTMPGPSRDCISMY